MRTFSAVILFMVQDEAKIKAILSKHGASLSDVWADEGTHPDIRTGQVVQCDSTHDTRMGVALAELEAVINHTDKLEAVTRAWDKLTKVIPKIQRRCF